MPRYLHDHSTIVYRRTTDMAETGYEVRLRKGDKLVGRVRRSKVHGTGWAWQAEGAGNTDWIWTNGTREDAADRLLSAYSPSAVWLI